MNGDPSSFTTAFWILLLAFVVAITTRRFNVPYALALVVTGLAVGAPRLLPQVRLDPATLFTVFLPPLLFESAINLRAEALRRHWKPILLYALLGTPISAFIVGGLTAWGLQIPFEVALVFGALISATDPISVIAVFKRLGTGKRLTLIMEAESLFNDGVAVVLFTVALGTALGGSPSVAGSLWQFVRVMAGGILLGAVIGWLACRVHHTLDDHLVEITLTTIVAFGSYLCAEALHVSGVIAVVAAGLVVGNFGIQKAMSPGTRLEVVSFWEYAAFVVNSIVFLLVGIEAGFVRWWDRIDLAGIAVGAVLIGRASIYPLSCLVNWLGGNVLLTWQHVLFWGGLRGALSMALVLGLGREFPHRDTLVAGTFGVVLFSLLVQGMTLARVLRRLGLTGMDRGETEYQRLASERLAHQAALRELERLWVSEAYPSWTIKALTEEYRRRLEELERAMAELPLRGETLAVEQDAEIRRLALLAEKSMLNEAERRGWLDEEEWQRLAERIDAELVALAGKRA